MMLVKKLLKSHLIMTHCVVKSQGLRMLSALLQKSTINTCVRVRVVD